MSTVAQARKRAVQIRENTRSAIARHKDFLPDGVISSPQHDYGFSGSRRATYEDFRRWLYVCVNTIAKKLAAQPWCAGEIKGASPNARAVKARERSVEELEDHPVFDALANPNDVQGQFEFLYMTYANLLITGWYYWVGGFGDDGKWTMTAVPTSWIEPIHKPKPFSAFKLRTPYMTKAILLEAEQVQWGYLPDPQDPLKAMAPPDAIRKTLNSEHYLVNAQEQILARGIYPNVVVTVAEDVDMDGKKMGRPVLNDSKRRQLLYALRETVGATLNYGEPAIIDGLIESIHRLGNTPQEMDFQVSEQILKERILQVYSLNKYLVGASDDVNRAQAVEAMKQGCELVFNPLLDNVSNAMTEWVGPQYDKPTRLVLWLQKCEAKDPDLELRRWSQALARGTVTQNEYRANILGLPPLDDKDKEGNRVAMLDTPSGLQAVSALMALVARGEIPFDNAAAVLELFLGIPAETAHRLVGGIEGTVDTVQVLPDGDTFRQFSDRVYQQVLCHLD